MSNRSILPIDWTLPGATILSQKASGSDGNEGALYISLSFSITGASPSDCLMLYSGHSLVDEWVGEFLPLCRDAVGVFYSPSRIAYMLI